MTTSSLIPSVELQKAIYSILSTNAKVVSTKTSNPQFPFIELGLEIERDNSTKTDERSYHNLTIHTWTKSNSSIDSKTINQTVKDQIVGLKNVNGFFVDSSKLDNMFTLTEADGNTTIWHGVLQFEITLTRK